MLRIRQRLRVQRQLKPPWVFTGAKPPFGSGTSPLNPCSSAQAFRRAPLRAGVESPPSHKASFWNMRRRPLATALSAAWPAAAQPNLGAHHVTTCDGIADDTALDWGGFCKTHVRDGGLQVV